MGNKNYSNFSKKTNQQHDHQITVDEVLELSESQIKEAEATIVEEPVENLEQKLEPIAKPEPVKGVIAGCASLRVRAESNTDSEVLCILEEATELLIDLDNSTDNFYKVITADGTNGYCMKKFINIV